MKTWQDFSAFKKVKISIEGLVAEVATALETLLDDPAALQEKDALVAHCSTSLAQASGVLRALEYQEFALLADEMKALLEDIGRGGHALQKQEEVEALQLLYVAAIDFPALLEGVLSGQIRQWHEYSQLFNRIRKARSRSLVFCADTLLRNSRVDFADTLRHRPASLRDFFSSQSASYEKARLMLRQGQEPHKQVRTLRTVFVNLEMVCRDFRLGTLWALCSGLAEAIVEDDPARHARSVRLLSSFSRIIGKIATHHVRVLDRNIPDDILEKVLDEVAAIPASNERLLAARIWYQLDPRLGRDSRSQYSQLMVGFYRKEACLKGIRLLSRDISSITDTINSQIQDDTSAEGQDVTAYVSSLARIQDTAHALQLQAVAEVINGCLDACEDALLHSREDEASNDAPLHQIARALYQSELMLNTRSRELERAVFGSLSDEEEEGLTEARLNLVVEVIRNFGQVINAINHFVDSGYHPDGLRQVPKLLHEATIGLQNVPLPQAAAWTEAARAYAVIVVDSGHDFSGDDSFQHFTRLLINTLHYLEQLSIGRGSSLEHLADESAALAKQISSFQLPTEAATSQEADEQAVAEQVAAEKEAAEKEAAEDIFAEVGNGDALVAAEADTAQLTQQDSGLYEEVDADLLACFMEEAGEILQAMDLSLAEAALLPTDADALGELRRGFHTLKGSGRMVNAAAVPDLAWSVENVLNQVLAGRLESGTALLESIQQVRDHLPAMLEDLGQQHCEAANQEQTAALIERMNSHLQAESDAPHSSAQTDVAAEGSPSSTAAQDEMADVIIVDAERQISEIRRLLAEAARDGLDDEGLPVRAASFLIPVHTLHGSCRIARLDEIGAEVGRLEATLQQLAQQKLSFDLRELLECFSDFAGCMVEHVRTAGLKAESQTLDQHRRRFTELLQNILPAHSPNMGNMAPQEPAGEDELILQGFLNEANGTLPQINSIFARLRQTPSAIQDSELLKEQLTSLEGAAQLCDQEQIADVCHALCVSFHQHAQQQFQLDDTVLDTVETCLQLIERSLRALAAGETTADCGELLNNLRAVVNLAVQQQTRASKKADEEQVEDSLLEIFREEAGEILQELDSALPEWQQAPADALLIDSILRSLHTLKGSAALVGNTRISEAAHSFETLIIDNRASAHCLDSAFFNTADEHLHTLQRLHTGQADDEAAACVSEPAVDEEATIPTEEDRAAVESTEAVTATEADNIHFIDFGSDLGKPPSLMDAPESKPAREGQATDEHIRVSGKLLKSLLNDADEISVAHNRIEQNMDEFTALLKDMDETLERLEGYVKSFETHARPVQPAQRIGATADAQAEARSEFDALEMDRFTELQQTSLSLLEDYEDLRDIRKNMVERIRDMDNVLADQQRSATRLQDGLISSQMVPFAGIVPRLRRLTRQISAELDKQVSIRFSNPEGKMDRNILQAIVYPLEHMIRNAIDHGVETAQERADSGKPAQAQIHVNLYRHSASMILEVSDDGRGLNVDSIRRRAIERGLLRADEEISEESAYRYILQSGFSTSETVSRISGRGVGLDVVSNEIAQIGGDIDIQSQQGSGTTFRIRLPMSLSLNRSLLFKVTNTEFVVLLNTIEGISLQTVDTLRECYQSEGPSTIDCNGQQYELVYMGSLLDLDARPGFEYSGYHSASLLLLKVDGRNVALQVDSVIGSRSLVVKSLGAQFGAVQGFSGGVILGDGNVVIVLDPVGLVESFLARHGEFTKPPTQAPGRERQQRTDEKTVLVVDDSITVRKVTSAILKRNGMNVVVARNGMEAVEILQDILPDVMLLDIEMPKMNGFEVASYVRRQTSEIKDLPIIMITSRIGDKHRSRAEEIGVNQYMCKPFQEDALLAAIAASW